MISFFSIKQNFLNGDIFLNTYVKIFAEAEPIPNLQVFGRLVGFFTSWKFKQAKDIKIFTVIVVDLTDPKKLKFKLLCWY